MMVAAISEAASTDLHKPSPQPRNGGTNLRQNSPARRPLLPAEKDNGLVPRKPKSKQVSSRYMSPSPSTSTSTSTTTTTNSSSSSSRRCASPLLSRSTNTTPSPIGVPKRAQSADRRRPAAARPVTPVAESRQGNAGEVSAAAKMLITSTRRLSVSFQGEAFSLPISKTKEAPSLSSARKATPERRRATPVRDQVDSPKAVDQNQHRWPARTRQLSLSSNQLSRSVDCSGDDKKKLPDIGSGIVVRALQQSMVGGDRRPSFDCRLSLDLGNSERLSSVHRNPEANYANESSGPSDLTASDTDSVSSGSTSGKQDGLSGGKGLPWGIAVSAKFWQETNSRLRRLQDPGSPLSTSPGSRTGLSSKFVQSKKFSDSPLSSPRGIASPVRGAARSASPSKLWTSSTSSPLRGNPSPLRARSSVNGPSSSSACSTPSILSFSVDLRRGKMGENRIVDAHMLRLLYNRHLQWRFVNARADFTSMEQKLNAEKNLWNAWVTISELRHSVTLKRVKLLLLRKKLKLTSILRGQMHALEEWAIIDRDHSNSLMGVMEALKASTLRLPITGKTVADIQNLKDAVGSAVDVVHAMASTICSLSTKVEGMNCLIHELANVTTKEQILLQQCKDFMSTLSAKQVTDCSLRTHILQLSCVPSTSSLTTRVYN